MLTQNLVACRNEDNFKNALDFIPERWIRGSPAYQEVSPYLVLPFSHGPRTCIARRLAEQNMLSLLLGVSIIIVLIAFYLYNRYLYSFGFLSKNKFYIKEIYAGKIVSIQSIKISCTNSYNIFNIIIVF